MNDPFDCLQIVPTYDINADELLAQYLKHIKAAHPDQTGHSAEAEVVNQAYQTLKDPLQRAQALMRLMGLPIEQDADPTFLMDIMDQPDSIPEKVTEMREHFAQAFAKKDKDAMIQHYGQLLYLEKCLSRTLTPSSALI